jgi:hypothetical protein
MSGPGIIAMEGNAQCDECGKIDECRPYGVGGKVVCHPCGMKNPEEARARMAAHIFGDPLPKKFQQKRSAA